MKVTAAVLALVAVGMIAGGAQAAMIDVVANHRIDDYPTYGSNSQASGFQADGTPPALNLFVGESSDNIKTFASVFEFNIDAFRADINNSAQVLLKLPALRQISAKSTFRVVAMDDVDEDGVVTITDIDGGTSVAVVDTADVALNEDASDVDGIYVIDVTNFVKADALNLGNNFSSFRIEQTVLTNEGDGSSNVVEFQRDTAQLETVPVPEPASLMILGIGALVALRRRRMSA